MKNFTLLTTLMLIALLSHAQWEWQNPLPQGNSIYGISFVNENNGWAVSNHGTILHTNNGGATGFEEIQIHHSVLDIKTYPNPFTTSTTIAYELQQPSTVQITIYDHPGKQIEVIEKRQPQGLQKVVWSPQNLPNGIYFT